MLQDINDQIAEIYDTRFSKYGPTPEASMWFSERRQLARFEVIFQQILQFAKGNSGSISDIGCGYGAFLAYLLNNEAYKKYSYFGYDISCNVIEFCKKNEFQKNSLIKIKDYTLNKNERILKRGDKILKITEKEIDFICNLKNSKSPLSKKYILEKIWFYSPGTETHTIETHIYRLRKKVNKIFEDQNFIKNTKLGYSL